MLENRVEIKDIKQFMMWCRRKENLRKAYNYCKAERSGRKRDTEMNAVLDMLNFKCWYYEQGYAMVMRNA